MSRTNKCTNMPAMQTTAYLPSYTSEPSQFPRFSTWSNSSFFSPPKQHLDFGDNHTNNELFPKPDVFDSDKYTSIDQLKRIDAALQAYDSANFDVFSSCDSPHTLVSSFGTPPGKSFNYMTECNSNSLFSFSNESSPGGYSKSSTDSDVFGFGGANNWNCDYDLQDSATTHFNEQVYKNELADSFYTNVPEKQIETILQEALEALVLNKCDDEQFLL